ncbi:hypothetical protein D9M69_490030 [compost metagenome]
MDRHFLDLRMGDETALHLEAGDVLATTTHVVLLAVEEEEKTILVHLPDVAGVEPHVAHHLESVGRAVPVTLEHHVGFEWSHDQLTGRAIGQFDVKIIDHPDVKRVAAPPGAVGFVRLAEGQHGDNGALGKAEAGPTYRVAYAKAFAPARLQLRGERCRIDLVELAVTTLHGLVVRSVSQQRAHGSQQVGLVGAAAFDIGPESRNRKSRIDHGAGTDHQVAQDGRDRRIEVEQGQWRPGDGLRRASVGFNDLPRLVAGIVVADHAALGWASGAAGIDEHSQVTG